MLRVCTIPDNHYCWTYTWNRDHYEGVVDNGPNTATLTVEGLNGESADLHGGQRSSCARNRVVVTPPLVEEVSNEGNSIRNGEWSDSNGASGRFEAAWGTAIHSLPEGKYPTQSPTPVWVPNSVEVEMREGCFLLG